MSKPGKLTDLTAVTKFSYPKTRTIAKLLSRYAPLKMIEALPTHLPKSKLQFKCSLQFPQAKLKSQAKPSQSRKKTEKEI